MTRYQAHFDPQAWVNDYAVSVDPEGEQTWDCTAFASDDTDYTARVLGNWDGLDRDDVFIGDPAAPEWVRNWHGPFTITIETVR